MVRAFLLGLACACATTGGDPPAAEPPPPFEEQVENAARVARDQPALVVRYNPVQCPCPAFEVQLGARWIRLQVEGTDVADSPAAALEARGIRDRAADRVAHYEVRGDLSTSARRCAQGALFLTLLVAGDEE